MLIQYRDGSVWRTQRKLTSQANGAFLWRGKLAQPKTFRAYAAAVTHGGKRHPSTKSPAQTIAPMSQIGALSLSTEGGASPAILVAAFSPARPGRSVELQQLRGSDWVPVQSGQQGASGTITFTYPPPLTQLRTTVRAVTAATDGAPTAATDPVDVIGDDRHLLVGVHPDGTVANGYDTSAYDPSISDDGSLVAFAASFIGPGADYPTPQVYVRDIDQGTTRMISSAANGAPGIGRSTQPVISGNGRYVVYVTEASNIVPEASWEWPALVRHDLATGVTSLVSTSPLASYTVLGGDTPAITPDGSRIVFRAKVRFDEASTGSLTLVRDMNTDQVWEVKRDSELSTILDPVLSGNGRYVVFTGQRPRNFTANTYRSDIFRYDLDTDNLEPVSVDPSGVSLGDQSSNDPSVSHDGTLISFASTSTNLVADGKRAYQVYVRNMATETTVVGPGAGGSPDTELPTDSNALSSDAQVLAEIWLVPGTATFQSSPARELRVYDLQTGQYRLVASNYASPKELSSVSLTPDGKYAVYINGFQVHRVLVSGFLTQ